MKKKLSYLLVSSMLFSPIIFGTSGCATKSRTSPEAYVDDNTLSAKIKSDLLRDPLIRGTDVNVSTYQRQVQLSGFVGTQEERERAGEIAASTPGVIGVRNELVVRTGR